MSRRGASRGFTLVEVLVALMVVAMGLAALMVASFLAASVYAVAMLRGRRDRYHRIGLFLPFTVGVIVSPFQILVGDYLFACAADLAASLGVEAVRIQARTFSRLVHGQIAETIGPAPGEDKIDHYLAVMERLCIDAEPATAIRDTLGRILKET